MKKLIKENLHDTQINDSPVSENVVYRIRMVKDIEFTQADIDKYKEANSLYDADLKKTCTGLAKTKWRNAVNAAIESKSDAELKGIDDRAFKFYI